MASRIYSPTQKAAILLLSLGEELAADIFRNMDHAEVRALGAALNQVGKVEQADVDAVLQEFMTLLNNKSNLPTHDAANFAQKAIQLAFKGEAGQRMASELGQGPVRMRALETADAPTLARILQSEHPQTTALILAHGTADKASAILMQLNEAFRTEVLVRLSHLEPVDPDLVREIDQHLMDEIAKMGSIRQRKLGGPTKVAEILNQLDRDGLDLLEKIEERHPQLSEDIRLKMFTFDDLVHVDARGMQELVKAVPRETLTLALRAASDSIKTLFYQSMSERSARMLADDITALGTQKRDDVMKAQRDILKVVRRLEASGHLVIERNTKRQVI